MQILNLRQGKFFKMGKGQNWRVVHPDMGASQLTLNHGIHGPGHEFTQHIHDESEDFFVVLEGGVSVRQGDMFTPINAGDGVFVPRGEVHGTVNTTDSPARLMSFQSPPDLALYRGERDRAAGETPKPKPGHRSAVQIITLSKGGPVFGKPGDWRCVVSPERGSKHLLAFYIRLAAGDSFVQEPVAAETIYVLTEGKLEIADGDGTRPLSADDVVFLKPGDGVSLARTVEGATLIVVQAVV